MEDSLGHTRQPERYDHSRAPPHKSNGSSHRTNQTFSEQTRFVFGHAGEGYDITGNKADIKAFQDYLEKLLEFGKKEILQSGKSKQEFLKNTTIPGVKEWKGDGIERSLNAVWEELTS